MRIAVCDDEALFRDKIIEYIETVIKSFSCGEELRIMKRDKLQLSYTNTYKVSAFSLKK